MGEPGTVIVPGRLLAEITRSLPALAVEVATDADTVNLTCGSAEFTLFALPAEEYPELPAPPPLAGTVDGGVLGAAISQVVAAASRDDTLPMLTGVCLDIDGAAADAGRDRPLPPGGAGDALGAGAAGTARGGPGPGADAGRCGAGDDPWSTGVGRLRAWGARAGRTAGSRMSPARPKA